MEIFRQTPRAARGDQAPCFELLKHTVCMENYASAILRYALDIQEGRYMAYAIGVDVRAELPGQSELCDAVQIIVRHSRLNVPDRYMAYIPTDEGYRFEDLILLLVG